MMKKWSKKKKITISILSVLTAYLVYLIVGMLAPFAVLKSVSDSYKTEKAQKLADMYFPVTKKDYHDEMDEYGSDRAYLVETPMEALDIRIQMLQDAKESIILTTFDMREGESTKDLWAVMLEAADRGVKIQVLIDGISGFLRIQGNDFMKAVFSHPNVQLRIYNMPNPLLPWTIHGRMHDKYIVVDGKVMLMGGRNTFDYFLGEYNTADLSYDREILIYDTTEGENEESAVEQVLDYFHHIWNLDVCDPMFEDKSKVNEPPYQETRKELGERLKKIQKEKPELFLEDVPYMDMTVPVVSASLITGPTGIFGKEPQVFASCVELMKRAQESVVIQTPYAVFSDWMEEEMMAVAQEVDQCKMLINSVANGDNVVASSDYLRHKKEILDTGIEVYEYDGGHSFHGKTILIDNRISIIGSYNFDMRSTYVDTEMMLVVESEPFAKILKEKMDGMEGLSRKVIDETSYEENPNVTVREIPWKKQFIFDVVGLGVQICRYLV